MAHLLSSTNPESYSSWSWSPIVGTLHTHGLGIRRAKNTCGGSGGIGADLVGADKPRRAAPALRRDDAPGLVGVEGRLALGAPTASAWKGERPTLNQTELRSALCGKGRKKQPSSAGPLATPVKS